MTNKDADDAISRRAVLDIINFEDKWLLDAKGHNADTVIAFSGMRAKVSALPSVTPMPKTGHWIRVTNGRGGHECDICHEYAPSYQDGDEYLTKYCPNCGAKMQEVEE